VKFSLTAVIVHGPSYVPSARAIRGTSTMVARALRVAHHASQVCGRIGNVFGGIRLRSG
jgi:hypothetical protein